MSVSPSVPYPSQPAKNRRLAILRVLALIVVIAISVYVFSIRDQAKELSRYGYPGIFLLSILANGTVLIPAPGVLFVFALGAVFNPFWVAVAAGSGAAIGEMTGYLAGFSGQGVAERVELYQKLLNWMSKNSVLTCLVIIILAFIPNPFFDLAGMASGALKVPVARFLVFCWIGKLLKMLLFAYAGASALGRWFGSP
ncbi:MAG: VTT domain-containing protein [Omnitrophica WOR_2 bacterium]